MWYNSEGQCVHISVVKEKKRYVHISVVKEKKDIMHQQIYIKKNIGIHNVNAATIFRMSLEYTDRNTYVSLATNLPQWLPRKTWILTVL